MPHTNVSDLNLVRVNPPTPREINLLNRRFWKKQSRLLTAPAIEASSFQEAMKNWEPGSSTPASVSFRDLELTVSEQQHRQIVSWATAKGLTPEQYVATQYITKELERLGVTDEQLLGMQFRGSNKEWPFDLWSYTWLGKIPDEAIPLVKAYCALKWTVIEKPCYSRDKEDAWRLVNETMAAPTLAIGERARDAQSNRAKKPRGRITDDGRTIGQVIADLAVKPQHRRETARELWPHLRALLGEDLDPEEITDQTNSKDSKKWAYLYDFRDGRRKKMSFLRFKNIVSNVRNLAKSP